MKTKFTKIIFLLLLFKIGAHAQQVTTTGTNTTTHSVPNAGSITSDIPVSGLPTVTSKVTVTVNMGIPTTEISLQAYLTSPSGKHIMLFSRNGDFNPFSGTLVFDQAAANSLPYTSTIHFDPGTYKPSYGNGDSAPPGTTADLDDLRGDDPNGQWQLHFTNIVSTSNADFNGWSITITAVAPVSNNTITAPAITTFCGTGNPAQITGATPGGGDGSNYAYQWKSSADNVAFTTISGAQSANYTPPAGLTQTTYYLRTVTSDAASSESNHVTLTVNALPAVAAIAGTTNVNISQTTQLSDATSGGTWASDNASVATVNASGLVTGVTAGTAHITYTVSNGTCSNQVSAAVNVLASSTNPTLSLLTLSAGVLSPAFASGITSYTASVANTVGSITLTPTTTDTHATVMVNGTAVTSGTASGNITLNVGTNTITTTVTAQDGITTDTYMVYITRQPLNQTLVVGAATTAVAFPTNSGVIYNWTNSAPGIGLAASGTGNIASFTTTNTTGSPITATITATPAPLAYVANRNSNNVSVINTATNTVVATVLVGNVPTGTSVSPDGSRVYIANFSSNTVSVINTATNTVVATIPVGSKPFSVSVSPDGSRIYVINFSSNTVSVINTVNNAVVATVPVGLVPAGISISLDGSRVYVANENSNNVSVINTATNTVVAAIAVGTAPQSVSVSPDGSRAYVTNFNADNVSVINTTTNTVIANIATGTQPYGVSISPDGSRVYVTNFTADNVSVINTATNAIVATIPVGSYPVGISISPDGSRIYVANENSNTVSVINAATNTVVATVPVGTSPESLGNFITGTGVQPLSFTITVNPSAIPTLSNLTISSGTLSPVFDSGTLTYAASVANTVGSITLTPTTTDAHATVTVNGTAVTSGTASGNITLNVGDNPITTVVTAQDGTTTQTYTTTVTRAKATPTITFNALTAVSYGTTDFSPGATSDNSGIAVTYSSDNSAVATIVSGKIHIIGAGTANITASQAGDATHLPAPDVTQQLTVNTAALTITTTSTSKTYGSPNPTFAVTYSGFVGTDNAASLTAAPTISTTAVTGSGVGTYPITASGAAGANYNISYVDGILTVNQAALTITATSTSKTYGSPNPTFVVTYSGFVGTDNAASLTAAPTISTTAVTGSGVGTYPITASGAAGANYNISYVDGTLTINRAALTITANNQSRSYGVANPTLTASYTGLVNGDTPASLTTAPTLSTTATMTSLPGSYPITASGAASSNYTIGYTAGTLTIVSSTNANLSNLSISSGALSPAFAVATTAYTVAVGNSVTSITITPTVADATATIKVNGNTLASGSASGNLPLAVGQNVITTVVTAQDGLTKITYTVTVTRAPSSNASLSYIGVSDGSLTPSFSPTVLAYTDAVAYTVTTIGITLTPADPTATLKINGIASNSGSATSIPLTTGDNAINVVVTAQDGTTTLTYTLIVHQGLPPQSVVANNILTPNGDGKNDYWIIKDILFYPNNVVTVYDRAGRGVYTKKGYANDWTGTLNGVPLTEDTYYYVVDLDTTHRFTGFITILRNRK